MNIIVTYFKLFVRFWTIIFRDFYLKGCITRACALTYTTLLAIVPLMFVFVSILSIFPIFHDIPSAIQHFIFDNFVPKTGHTVLTYIQSSLNRASTLPIMSILFLLITAIMMMLSIESNLNETWNVKFTRHLTISILLYWAVLTLGPLLLASSFLLSANVNLLKWLLQGEAYHINIIILLPFIATFLGFCFLYIIVPHAKVKIFHASVGALVATVLFEVAKRLFAFYVIYFPTYQKLYGVLATIPLFIFWLYCCWIIFLFGGLIVNALRLEKAKHNETTKHSKLIISLTIIEHLFKAQQHKYALSVKDLLQKELRYSTLQIQQVIDDLILYGYISQTSGYKLFLSSDIHELTLKELINTLQYYVPTKNALTHAKLPHKLKQVLNTFDEHTQKTCSISLADLYSNN